MLTDDIVKRHDRKLYEKISTFEQTNFLQMNIAISKNGIPIRLTSERWQYITTGHPEIADYYYEILDTIENPDIIYEGNNDAKIAIRKFQENISKLVVAVYKETKRMTGL